MTHYRQSFQFADIIFDMLDKLSVIFSPFVPESFASRQFTLTVHDTGSQRISKLLYSAMAICRHLQIDLSVDQFHALMGNDTGFRAALQLARRSPHVLHDFFHSAVRRDTVQSGNHTR